MKDNQIFLSSIDVLDTTTQQWWTPTNLHLPQPMYGITLTVSATHLCAANAHIVSGTSTDTDTPNSMWQIPVSALTKVLANKDHSPHQWTESAPTPNYRSALLKHNPSIVGGHHISFKPTADIAVYDSHCDNWSTVGQLLEPRLWCTVVSLSRCSFLVCGGRSDVRDESTLLRSVEVANML